MGKIKFQEQIANQPLKFNDSNFNFAPINFQNAKTLSTKIFSSKKISNIDLKEYFKPINELNDSMLSIELEEKKFAEIKNKFGFEQLNDLDILKFLAYILCDGPFREELQIDSLLAKKIFVEATDQLLLLGENISEMVESLPDNF